MGKMNGACDRGTRRRRPTKLYGSSLPFTVSPTHLVFCDASSPSRLWQHVTRAVNNKDQTEATNEKFILEEAQRKLARERKVKCEDWIPALFEQDPITGEWHYRYAE